MNLRNLLAVFLSLILIVSAVGAFSASAVNSATSQDAMASYMATVFQTQIEQELGEDLIAQIEEGETSCEEVIEKMGEPPFECSVVADEGLEAALAPQVENMTAENEEIQQVQEVSDDAYTYLTGLSALLFLSVFAVARPSNKGLEYLGVTALILGVVLVSTGTLVEQGTDAAINQMEGVPEEAEALADEMIEAEPTQNQIQKASTAGIIFAIAGILALVSYRYRKQLGEQFQDLKARAR